MLYQLIKADLILNSRWMYLLIILTLLGANSATLPPIFILLIITLAFLINQFYYDQQSKTNRYFISLPVSKNIIVQSRYISIVAIAIFYVLVQWVLGFIGFEVHYAFSWKDVIAVICLNLIITGIVVPLVYLIPSFIIAVGTIFIIMFFGTFYFFDALISVLGLEDSIIFNDLDPGLVLLVEMYFPYQPYILLMVISITVFYLSCKISELIFSRRNF